MAAAVGVLTTSVGAILQTGARGSSGIMAMIAGRIVCGFGLAIVSTSVPLYQRLSVPEVPGDACLTLLQ